MSISAYERKINLLAVAKSYYNMLNLYLFQQKFVVQTKENCRIGKIKFVNR